MLNQAVQYDASLESFSRPLLNLAEYTLDDDGRMTVTNDVDVWYRYVDMPDRRIDLFIRFCLQNGGRLSARKRASHFDFLTDDEVKRMEAAVQAAYRTVPRTD